MISAVMFGLAPALRAARADLVTGMKETDVVSSGRRRIGRSLLVGAQVALSVVLLVVAAFIWRGFAQQLSAGPGFRTDHLLMMSFDPALMRYRGAGIAAILRTAGRAVAIGAGREVGDVDLATCRWMACRRQRRSRPRDFSFHPGFDSAAHAHSVVDEQYFQTLESADRRGARVSSGRYGRLPAGRHRQRGARRPVLARVRI